MSDPQHALIDDIAAEYPDLREDPHAELGLTDEALRQFANAAAMHYELSGGGGAGEAEAEEEGGAEDAHGIGGGIAADEMDRAGPHPGLDPALAQVVSGSIPPPPRPTYHAHAAGEKRKRSDTTTYPGSDGGGVHAEEQPIQPQGDHAPSHLLSRVPGHQHAAGEHGTPSPPTTTTPFPPPTTAGTGDKPSPSTASAGGGLPLQLAMYRSGGGGGGGGDSGGLPMHPSSDTSLLAGGGHAVGSVRGSRGKPSGAGRARVRSHGGGEEMMLTDGGGEGSDPGVSGPGGGGGGGAGGRKEGKDERSARRAEQNRRAQQNFRKRREEQMKEQAARLEVLIPQMEEMKRQQAETGFLLEALKLENTALRAVLVHAVKHGAKILDPQGELVGVSSATSMGMVTGTHPHAFPPPLPRRLSPVTDAAEDVGGGAVGEQDPSLNSMMEDEGESSEETMKAVQDVYAALDRLGARTHVYARTIVPLVTTPEEQQGHGQDGGHHGSGAHGISMNSAVARSRHPGGASAHAQVQGKGLQHPTGVAQSSIRTAQHPHHPHPHSNHQQQHQAQGRSPYPATAYGIALPPFPGPAVPVPAPGSGSGTNGRPSSSASASGAAGGGGGPVSEQMRAVEEAIAEIDPVLREAEAAAAVHEHEGEGQEGEDAEEGMMVVDPSTELSLS